MAYIAVAAPLMQVQALVVSNSTDLSSDDALNKGT